MVFLNGSPEKNRHILNCRRVDYFADIRKHGNAQLLLDQREAIEVVGEFEGKRRFALFVFECEGEWYRRRNATTHWRLHKPPFPGTRNEPRPIYCKVYSGARALLCALHCCGKLCRGGLAASREADCAG